jgi:hypothetical protein
MQVVAAMLDEAPASCRELARRFRLDKMTVWQWRRKIATALLGRSLPALSKLVELQAEPVRESRKASREWVRHRQDPCRFPAPNRPRWVDVDRHGSPLPMPLAAYQLRVVVGLDPSGCRPLLVPVAACPVFAERCDPKAPIQMQRRPGDRMSGPAVPHGRATEDWRAEAIATIALPATADAAAGGTLHARLGMANAAALDAAFTGFMRRFRGPAVGHLRAYVAWFIARLERHLPGGMERLRARLSPALPTPNQDMNT